MVDLNAGQHLKKLPHYVSNKIDKIIVDCLMCTISTITVVITMLHVLHTLQCTHGPREEQF